MFTEPTGSTQAEAAPEPEPQAPPVAAAEPAAAQPNDPADIAGLLDAATDARLEGNEKEADRLDALLQSRTSDPAQAEEPTDLAAANEDTTEEDEEAGDEAPEVPTGDQPPAPDGKLPDRIRINHLSEEDKAAQNAINALTRGGMTLKEATARVLGAAQAEPEPEPEAEPEALAPETEPEVAELEQKVADLKARLRAEGASEGLYNETIADLTAELSEANAELSATRREVRQRSQQEASQEQQAQREAAAFEAQRNAVFTDTVKKFPTMGDKQSEHWQLASDLALAAQNPQHRDHAKSLSVEAPEYFATKAAKVLGIQPATGTAPAKARPTPPASPTAQPPATRPASGTRGSAPPAAQKSAAERAAQLEAETDAILEGRASSPRRSMLRGGVFVR